MTIFSADPAVSATVPIWPFGELIPLRYGLILADPPWSFTNYSPKGWGKSPHAHYQCMNWEDIARLPVNQLAHPDCLLIMWATWPLIQVAMKVMERWGFTYKTGGSWAKLSKTGGKLAFGTGYVLRSASEPFLLGTIGKPAYASRSVRNLIQAPVREHSRKPKDMRVIARQLCPAVPAVELFAREPWEHGDVWGNQTDRWSGTHGCDGRDNSAVLDGGSS